MRISILIIAHNEEKYIRRCLNSVTSQSYTPDEIILVAHNCIDKTEAIVQEFPTVRVVSFKGLPGSWRARVKGFEEVTGDIVVCTDGDSYVAKNWLEEMIQPLKDTSISAVGSPVFFRGGWWAQWSVYQFFYFGKWFGTNPKRRPFLYFWGASFAVRKKDYEKVGGFGNLQNVRKDFKIVNGVDDWYLAVRLLKIGKIKITYKTKVHAYVKEKNIFQYIKRAINQKEDSKKLFEYYKKLGSRTS